MQAIPARAIRSVLIVDDDLELRELLGRFSVDSEPVCDGNGMRHALATGHFDVITLDLMLPGEDGLALCHELLISSDIPILMLSARCESTDRIVGPELGASDYMAKPFEPRELVARIQSVLRRVRTVASAARNHVPVGDSASMGSQLSISA